MGEMIWLGMALIGGLGWWGIIALTFVWCAWRKRERPKWLSFAIQFSAFIAFTAVFFEPIVLIGLLLFPLMWFFLGLWGLSVLTGHPDILAALVIGAVFAGLAAIWTGRQAENRWHIHGPAIRLFAPLCAMWIGGLVAAGVIAEQKIQSEAERLSASCVNSRSFASSIRIAAEGSSGTHAYAIIDGELYNWSYKQSRFYLNQGNFSASATNCPQP